MEERVTNEIEQVSEPHADISGGTVRNGRESTANDYERPRNAIDEHQIMHNQALTSHEGFHVPSVRRRDLFYAKLEDQRAEAFSQAK